MDHVCLSSLASGEREELLRQHLNSGKYFPSLRLNQMKTNCLSKSAFVKACVLIVFVFSSSRSCIQADRCWAPGILHASASMQQCSPETLHLQLTRFSTQQMKGIGIISGHKLSFLTTTGSDNAKSVCVCLSVCESQG